MSDQAEPTSPPSITTDPRSIAVTGGHVGGAAHKGSVQVEAVARRFGLTAPRDLGGESHHVPHPVWKEAKLGGCALEKAFSHASPCQKETTNQPATRACYIHGKEDGVVVWPRKRRPIALHRNEIVVAPPVAPVRDNAHQERDLLRRAPCQKEQHLQQRCWKRSCSGVDNHGTCMPIGCFTIKKAPCACVSGTPQHAHRHTNEQAHAQTSPPHV